MPFYETGTGRLHYELEGPEQAPVLVMSNSLGTNPFNVAAATA